MVLQYNRLHECITNGGGICQLATSEDKLTDLDELVGDNAVVMSVDSNTLSSLDHDRKEWIQKVFSFVKRYRIVQEERPIELKLILKCFMQTKLSQVFLSNMFYIFLISTSKDYRTIVDSEVGFALLRLSIEKDCNPLSHQGQ